MRLNRRLEQLEGLQQAAQPYTGKPSTRAHEALLEAIVRGVAEGASERAQQLVVKAKQQPHVPVNVARYILESQDATDRGRALAQSYLEAHREA